MAALTLSTTAPRRGFLRALAMLPLIGGGITLLGAPSAAAVPTTCALLRRYQSFLCRENLATLAEIQIVDGFSAGFDLSRLETYLNRVPMCMIGDDAGAEAIVNTSAPSTRAAVVLSAAGLVL